MSLSFVFVFVAIVSTAAATPATIAVEWLNITRPLSTVAAFQTVVNCATVRESPYHDQVFQRIADLGARVPTA